MEIYGSGGDLWVREGIYGAGGFYGSGDSMGQGGDLWGRGSPTSERGRHPQLPQAQVAAPPGAEAPRSHSKTPQGGP